ncbi:MAG TPA: MGMT family protein [Candidatus Nanoarchaeia archaeon]|nr:MGMT family protein [Candidatus Nanoarchaeia archaeon]
MKLDALWSLVRKIPKGKVSTYGILAKKLGTSPRAVGQALKKNTKLIIVPCHRVIKSNGELGGYVNGAKEKKRLLESEGVDTNNLLAFIDDMNI